MECCSNSNFKDKEEGMEGGKCHDGVDISYLDKFEFNSVYFEITSRCNAKCSYCYNNSTQKVVIFHTKKLLM